MKKFKNAILKVNTKAYLLVKKIARPLANNKGNIIEHVGMILIALVILAIFLTAMKTIMDNSMIAASSKMTALFS